LVDNQPQQCLVILLLILGLVAVGANLAMHPDKFLEHFQRFLLMLYRLIERGASLVPADMKCLAVSTKTHTILDSMIHTVLGIP